MVRRGAHDETMALSVQIVLQGIAPSQALEARIREDAAMLEHFYPRITSCRVAVDEIEKHHRQGRQFRVHVEVRAPGHVDVVSTLHHAEDAFVAVRDAFDSVRRQLEEAARGSRGGGIRHSGN